MFSISRFIVSFGYLPFANDCMACLNIILTFYLILFSMYLIQKSIVAFVASFAMSVAENMVKYAFSTPIVKSGRKNGLLGC